MDSLDATLVRYAGLGVTPQHAYTNRRQEDGIGRVVLQFNDHRAFLDCILADSIGNGRFQGYGERMFPLEIHPCQTLKSRGSESSFYDVTIRAVPVGKGPREYNFTPVAYEYFVPNVRHEHGDREPAEEHGESILEMLQRNFEVDVQRKRVLGLKGTQDASRVEPEIGVQLTLSFPETAPRQ